MLIRCQIRTSRERLSSPCSTIQLGFPADSKRLSGLSRSPAPVQLRNGPERAFTTLPTKFRMFRSKASRRDL